MNEYLINKIAKKITAFKAIDVKFTIDQFFPYVFKYEKINRNPDIKLGDEDHLLYFSAESNEDGMNYINTEKDIFNNFNFKDFQKKAKQQIKKIYDDNNEIQNQMSIGIYFFCIWDDKTPIVETVSFNEDKKAKFTGNFIIKAYKDINRKEEFNLVKEYKFQASFTADLSSNGKEWAKDLFNYQGSETTEEGIKRQRRNKWGKVINKIAKSSGNNILDDLYDFYEDGNQLINIIRQINSIIYEMKQKIDNYITNISDLEENINYLKEIKIDEFSTSSSYTEYKNKLNQIKKSYVKYENDENDEKKKEELKEYRDLLDEMKKYNDSYEKSCINVFRQKYLEDEDNVRNLLDTIHESGNNILN